MVVRKVSSGCHRQINRVIGALRIPAEIEGLRNPIRTGLSGYCELLHAP